MSAYKKLKSQDAFVTTYVAKKNWYYSGSNIINLAPLGIQVLAAVSSSTTINVDDTYDKMKSDSSKYMKGIGGNKMPNMPKMPKMPKI